MLTILFAACGLLVGSSIYVLLPLTHQLERTFDVNATVAQMANSIFMIFYAVGFIVFGPLSEIFSKKIILFVGMLLLAVLTLVTSLPRNIIWFLVFRGVQGLVGSSIAPVLMAYVISRYPESARANSIAAVTTSYLGAGVFGQILSTSIAANSDWRYVFLWLSMAYILLALFLLKIPNDSTVGTFIEVNQLFLGFLGLFRNFRVVRIFLVSLTLLLVFVGMYDALSTYLQYTVGFSKKEIFDVRAIDILGMLPSLLTGRITRVIRPKLLVLGGLAVSAMGLLVEAQSVTSVSIGFSSILVVMGITIAIPTLISAIGRILTKHQSLAVSIFMCLLFIGASLGPPLASIATFSIANFLFVGILMFSAVLILTTNLTTPPYE